MDSFTGKLKETQNELEETQRDKDPTVHMQQSQTDDDGRECVHLEILCMNVIQSQKQKSKSVTVRKVRNERKPWLFSPLPGL